MPYLQVDHLNKSFGHAPVITDLSFEMARGEFLVVFGPSGSGKTVLLRLLAGMLKPDSGAIVVGGERITDLEPEHRGVAMAFQNFALYPHVSAFENIASPLRARRVPAAEIQQRVVEVARLLRIDHVLSHLPRALSNGQKQRTALARSLVRRPAILLLDDPLRNVDAKIRYEMRLELPPILRSYQCTVLYVTQDYKEAMALGDRIGVLYDGAFQQLASPTQIYRQPACTRVARLFGDPPINLIPVQPQQTAAGIAVDIGATPVPLPEARAELIGRDCLIGLRPEDVSVHFEPAARGIPVRLDTITPLNVREVMLLTATDGTEIFASAPEGTHDIDVRAYRSAWASLDLGHALYFDRATATRI